MYSIVCVCMHIMRTHVCAHIVFFMMMHGEFDTQSHLQIKLINQVGGRDIIDTDPMSMSFQSQISMTTIVAHLLNFSILDLYRKLNFSCLIQHLNTYT